MTIVTDQTRYFYVETPIFEPDFTDLPVSKTQDFIWFDVDVIIDGDTSTKRCYLWKNRLYDDKYTLISDDGDFQIYYGGNCYRLEAWWVEKGNHVIRVETH